MKIDEDGMRASQAQDSLPNTPTNNVWPLTGRVIEDKTIQNVAEMRSKHINDLPFETCLFRKTPLFDAQEDKTRDEDDDDATKAKTTRDDEDDEKCRHAEKRVCDEVIWFTIRYVLKLHVSLFSSSNLSLDPWSL